MTAEMNTQRNEREPLKLIIVKLSTLFVLEIIIFCEAYFCPIMMGVRRRFLRKMSDRVLNNSRPEGFLIKIDVSTTISSFFP